MATFNELMQEYVNKDYFEIVAEARKITPSLLDVCKVIDEENNGVFALTAIILSAIGADGKISAKEQKFLCDVFDFDNDTIDKMISLYTGKEEDFADRLVDAMPDEAKAGFIHFVVLIAACDETISREETAFIAKLMQ